MPEPTLQHNVIEQIDAAMKALGAACRNHGRLTMHIPADSARDTDIIIGSALRATRKALQTAPASAVEPFSAEQVEGIRGAFERAHPSHEWPNVTVRKVLDAYASHLRHAQTGGQQ